MRKNIKRQSGFSLIELMVVILLIALLTGAGSAIYAQNKDIDQIRQFAYDFQGMVMKAQSMAQSATDRNIIGYEIVFSSSNSRLELKPLKLENDYLENVGVGELDYTDDIDPGVEPISTLTASDNAEAIMRTADGTPIDPTVYSITALAPSGRLLFNNREPDLDQDENIYSYYDYPPNSDDVQSVYLQVEGTGDVNVKRRVYVNLLSGLTQVRGE